MFFAVRPDERATGAIESCRRELCAAHGLQGRPIPSSRLHITLHFLGTLGELPEDVVGRATRSAALSAQAAPFQITLDHAKSFHNKRKTQSPVVLGSANPSPELVSFQRRLNVELKQSGFRNKLSSFTPHLTLLYDKLVVEQQNIAPIGWTVHEFVLLHSFFGRGKHEVLGRWALA